MTAINGEIENSQGVHLFDGQIITPSLGRIRKLSDVPYLQAMDIRPPEYLVPGIIARGSITMVAGPPGSLKTYLMLLLAISVASGAEFLGRRCKKCRVLILDYENPAHEIRWRLDSMTAETLIPGLYVWGIWNDQQPPKIGDPLLLSIADEEKPLIIFDPFRNSHGCDENSSTEMAGVMEQLVYMKSRGATIIFLHHVAKTEGSTSRGSSAIDGAVDLALVQTMDAESGIMELKTTKNRFGEGYCLSIRPDFDHYTFSITNSPQFAKRTAELEKLGEIIGKQPGLSQNAIIEASGMMRARVIDLLRKNT
jgi:AAA domain